MSTRGPAQASGAASAVSQPRSAAPRSTEPRSAAPRSAPEAEAASVPATRLPAGLAAVLGVLSSSAVVLDSNDRVLRASEAARTFGLVEGNSLVVGELLALARQVRRDGEIRE
ncbi:MAG TPA: hypothetical protein VF834_20750, partial [Streptosporangiaceae bacterium]